MVCSNEPPSSDRALQSMETHGSHVLKLKSLLRTRNNGLIASKRAQRALACGPSDLERGMMLPMYFGSLVSGLNSSRLKLVQAYKKASEEKELESNQPGNKSPFNNLRQKREGGIDILVEEVKAGNKNELRVLAKRCNMDDNTTVKEMSEETILKRVREAVVVWKKQQ